MSRPTMLRRSILLNGTNDENGDSGAETAESVCSKMSSPSSEAVTSRLLQPLLMNMHLLANPGDSLLLQLTLDRLLCWLWPSLHIFHVSERACPLRGPAPALPLPGPAPAAPPACPSLAVSLFLHEAHGEERILRALDFLQRPPWRYHHTEGGGGGGGPYLLPGRDLYSLGAGMPLWAVRPVHCGGEALRVTLYSRHGNFEDAVRLYETVLRRGAERQKAGFCWFTLRAEPGLSLQLALKRLAPGERAEPCGSAVLQFRVEEMGQLVPLLPHPCTPISATRWQTEDLDGNKILFQVKAPVQPPRPLTCAFPLACPGLSPGGLLRSPGSGSRERLGSGLGSGERLGPGLGSGERLGSGLGSGERLGPGERLGSGLGSGSGLPGGRRGGAESAGSDSCCSSPPGSSCYSSQRSSPAPAPPLPLPGGRPETNVDTGAAVAPLPPWTGAVVTPNGPAAPRCERPAAAGASALETLARELDRCLPGPGAGGGPGYQSARPGAGGLRGSSVDPTAQTLTTETLDEFFI